MAEKNYLKEWRVKNKDKVKQYNQSYYQRKKAKRKEEQPPDTQLERYPRGMHRDPEADTNDVGC